MAKGDSKRAQTAISDQRNLQLGQQSNLSNMFTPRFQEDRAADVATRGEIEDRYKAFNPDYSSFFGEGGALGGGGGGVSGGINPNDISSMGAKPYAGYEQMSQGLRPEFWTDFNKYMGNLDETYKGYKGFSETGGFSPEDLSNIRARSMAPTRGIYENMQNALARQQSLGNATNSTARLRGAREANSAISDVAQGTEANIAGLTQQGKEFGLKGMETTGGTQVQARSQVEQLDQQMRAAGLGGMTDIEKSRLSAELQNAQLNQSASGANASLAQARAAMQLNAAITGNNQRLASLQGWTGLYGTAPGASGQSADDLLALQGLSQGGNANLINTQIGASQIPSDWSQAMGNIGSTLGVAGQIGGIIAGMPGAGNNRGVTGQGGAGAYQYPYNE